jgi:arylsulfatase A-like enzyme
VSYAAVAVRLLATRRLVAVGVAVVVAAGLVASSDAAAQPVGAAGARPNIVVIITDDMRADQIDTMPTVMTDVVGKGRRFDLAFAGDPLCCPSRLSFLRGQEAHTHTVYNTVNATTSSSPYSRYSGGVWAKRVGVDRPTLANWLDQLGYFTVESGKFLNGYAGRTGIPGWDFWRQKLGGYYDFKVSVNGQWVVYDHGEYEADVVTDQAVAGIQASGTAPLFLWTAYFAPHTPFLPPARYDTASEAPGCEDEDITQLPSFDEAARDVGGLKDKPRWLKRRPALTTAEVREMGETRMVDSCRALLAVDDGVARILAALEQKDPGLDNTIVLFTSDQGVQNGQHQHDAKKVPYEETIRVPFAIRADGLLGGSASVDREHLVDNVDLAPTLLDLVGVDPASIRPGCPDSNDVYERRCVERGGGFDGTSFAPLFTGGPYTPRTEVLLEHWDPRAVASSLGFEYVPSYCGVRSATAKLVVYDRGRGLDWEAYDLVADPNELRSVVYSGTDGVPKFRTGGKAIYDALAPVLARVCDPPPPQHAGL